jgi:hypothetical protein
VSAVLKSLPQLAPLQAEEIDAVLAIEDRAYPFPWSRANFADSWPPATVPGPAASTASWSATPS